jgi:hypothetical protein
MSKPTPTPEKITTKSNRHQATAQIDQAPSQPSPTKIPKQGTKYFHKQFQKQLTDSIKPTRQQHHRTSQDHHSDESEDPETSEHIEGMLEIGFQKYLKTIRAYVTDNV